MVEFEDWTGEGPYTVQILQLGYPENPGRPKEEWYQIRFISDPERRYILFYFLIFKEKFEFFLIFYSKK